MINCDIQILIKKIKIKHHYSKARIKMSKDWSSSANGDHGVVICD